MKTIHDEAQTKYADQVRAAFQQQNGPSASPAPEQLKLDLSKQDVLNLLVGLELAKRVVAEKKIQVQDQITEGQLGEGFGVPGTEYRKLAADWYDLFIALQTALPAAELTDEARTEVYDGLVKSGVAPAGWTVEQQRERFADPAVARQVAAVVALSAAFRDEVKRQDVEINPRYSTLEIPALFEVPGNSGDIRRYDLPYLELEPSVTDLPSQEPQPSTSSVDPAAEGTAS
ncbi:hypothetical protein GCM10027614_38070 [Micromonospora vulcania]